MNVCSELCTKTQYVLTLLAKTWLFLPISAKKINA